MMVVSAAGCASKQIKPEWIYYPPPPATPHVVHLQSFNALGDLTPPRVTFVEMIRGGPPSPYIAKPAGVDYRDGHLYICDTGLNVVHDWNLATGRARRIGQQGKGALQKPVDVAVDDDGTIFVADTQRQEVVAFGPDGAFADALRPTKREAFVPTAVTATREKDGAEALLVADAASHEVFLFATTGSSVSEGDDTALFDDAPENMRPYFPTGIAAFTDDDGRRSDWVADAFNARLIRIGEGDAKYRTIGQPGDRYGDLGQPKHLDVGPDGVIFVADAAFRCVHLFNQEGQLLMLLGGSEDRPGGTPMPLGVAVADSLPENLRRLIPPDFDAHYFLFVTNTIGSRRISLYAVGLPRTP